MIGPISTSVATLISSSGLARGGLQAFTVSAFSYETEAQTFFTAALGAGVEPTDARKRTYNRLIKRLKGYGVWNKLTHLYLLAAANETISLINIKNPGTNNLVKNGSPTFTADTGFSATAASTANFLGTGVPLNSINQNDHSFGFYSGSTSNSDSGDMGAIDGSSNGISINPRTTGNVATWRSFTGSTTILTSAESIGRGLFSVSRSGAGSFDIHKRGRKYSTSSTASVTVSDTREITILKVNGGSASGRTIRSAFIGSSLTESELRKLYACIEQYREQVTYGDFYEEEAGIGTQSITADVIIYGTTSAAATAAFEVVRQGKTVAIIGGWRDRRIGGMSASGLGFTDFDNHAGLGGLPRWIITRINAIYGRADTEFAFEPRVFTRVLYGLMSPAKNGGRSMPIYYTNGVATVTKSGAAITSFTTTDGRTVSGSRFIDCSYEGDLLYKAGVTMTKGREAAGSGVEALGGFRGLITTDAGDNHQFKQGGVNRNIDPYNTPGNSGSGLLPGISRTVADCPADGTADDEIQAYNFRLAFSKNNERIVPLPSSPPPGYSASRYEPLGRLMAAYPTVTLNEIIKADALPGVGTDCYDINARNGWSTDMWGESKTYPQSTYAQRETLWKNQWNFIMGLWYYLQYDPDVRVTATVRNAALTYGFDQLHYLDHHENDDVFVSPQFYVREAWRMVSDIVWNGNDIAATDGTTPRSTKTIATASYAMDSHSTEALADPNGGTPRIWLTGNFEQQLAGDKIAPIPYEVIIPKSADCTNIFSTFAISATHVAFGSIRMEYTSMMMGQSAGLAAVHSINDNVTVQNVNYTNLRTALLASASLSGEVAPILPQLN